MATTYPTTFPAPMLSGFSAQVQMGVARSELGGTVASIALGRVANVGTSRVARRIAADSKATAGTRYLAAAPSKPRLEFVR